MSQYNIQSIIGLAGVSEDECEKARLVGRNLEVPMLLVAIWIVVVWYAELNSCSKYQSTLSNYRSS